MRRVLIAIAIAATCAGCYEQGAQNVAPPGSISGEGTIRRGVGPECPDTWCIETADGGKLWPVNDPVFQVDGLRVRYTAQKNEGAMSICMAGTNVNFTLIRKD
jgi:hypothetical protein